MSGDEGSLLVRDGADGPYCPVRYAWLEKLNRGRRSWVPLVIPDVPEINESVFGPLVWLGVIPRPLPARAATQCPTHQAGNEA